jgi:hypothetical protein
MLEAHNDFIKLAVDIRSALVAGGGEFHADGEALLIEEGCKREGIWGADWLPAEKIVRYGALINIRSKVNPSMEIQSQEIKDKVEAAIRKVFGK